MNGSVAAPMAEMGQSLPSHSALVRINVRFPTSSDRLSEITKASLRANCGREQMQQMQVHNADLLDYFAGTGE
jgi:hypothetical protein